MFLIKSPLSDEVISKVYVELGDLKKIQEGLNKQYFCRNIVKKDNNTSLISRKRGIVKIHGGGNNKCDWYCC